MDYDTYAEGEAVLGWLNADIRLAALAAKVEWDSLCSDLLHALHARFREERARIEILGLRCLRPGRPQPTYRYGTVVER